MKLRKKKGFTIIELVIVIAVIGILTAVLVPTFINLTNKANEAADQSLVKNLNTVLATAEADVQKGYKKPNNPSDMFDILDNEGYKGETLLKNQKSGKTILYKLSTNRFEFAEEDATKQNTPDFWEFTKDVPNPGETNKHSYYLYEEFNSENPINVKSGLDVGKNDEANNIVYLNSDANQKAVIRTNGGTLTIGSSTAVAPGTITHFGTLDEAIVYTTNTSFHTHGKIASMDLKAGKAVAEDKGYVALVKAASGTEVEEKDTGTFYIPSTVSSGDVDTTVATDLGYKVDTSTNKMVIDSSTEKGQERAETLNSNAYEISNKNELIAFRDAVNGGQDFSQLKVVLTQNIDMSGEKWVEPIGKSSSLVFKGKFDGQGHTIQNLSNDGFTSEAEALTTNLEQLSGGKNWGLFGYVGSVSGQTTEIMNLTIYAYFNDSVDGSRTAGIFAQGYGDNSSVKLSNIDIYGSLKNKKYVAGLVGSFTVAGGKLEFANCNNYANITAVMSKDGSNNDDGAYAAGILGGSGANLFVHQNSQIKKNLIFNGCHNHGDITSAGQAGGIVANVNMANSAANVVKNVYATTSEVYSGWKETTFAYSDCTNDGTITATTAGYGLFVDVGSTSTGNDKPYTHLSECTSESLKSNLGLYFAYYNCVGSVSTARDWYNNDATGNPNQDVLWRGVPTTYVNIWDELYARQVFNTLTLNTDYTTADVIVIEQYGGKYVYAYYSGMGTVTLRPFNNNTSSPTRSSLLEAIDNGDYSIKSSSTYHQGQADEATITIYQSAN